MFEFKSFGNSTNLFLLIGILTLFEATLTLPGIAGIILTVGMAVDANVLIFERIKEEKAHEKNQLIAFDSGYTKSRTAILDANITTFIAAIILFFLAFFHARISLGEIFEDYIHNQKLKDVANILSLISSIIIPIIIFILLIYKI